MRDEPLGGQARDVLTLEFLTEEITVKELIEERVHQEVRDYNAQAVTQAATPSIFRGLVQPSDSESTLNGYRMKVRRKIEWRPQAELAVRAFDENGFLVLIGERQAESLSERILVRSGTVVSFVKLTPMVGG